MSTSEIESNDDPANEMVSRDRRHRWVTNLVGTLVICAITALVLGMMGRVWWCQCDSIAPWSWDIWSIHNSQHAVDPYFFTHVLHGILLYGFLHLLGTAVAVHWKFLIAIAIESAWEILENSPIIIQRYREATISLDYFGDSITNSIFDIFACGIGYGIAMRVGWKGSLLYFAATELLLVWTIRDSLILNVVMLVWPLEAIKQWQM